jgi:hypothetical protein
MRINNLKRITSDDTRKRKEKEKTFWRKFQFGSEKVTAGRNHILLSPRRKQISHPEEEKDPQTIFNPYNPPLFPFFPIKKWKVCPYI